MRNRHFLMNCLWLITFFHFLIFAMKKSRFRCPPVSLYYERDHSNDNEDDYQPFGDLHREPGDPPPAQYEKYQGQDKEHYREVD